MVEFNFTGLHPTFLEALQRHEPSIAFALQEGEGRFVFFFFLKTDSRGNIKWGDLELFIFLARTQTMLRFKLLGNHKNAGDFKIRLNINDEHKIREELGIQGSPNTPAFDLGRFLARLNDNIPVTIPLKNKVEVIKQQKNAVKDHCREYIEEAQKIYLIRLGPVTNGGKPREETLRKLYMIDAPADDITSLISDLKQIKWTAYWTASESKGQSFSAIFDKFLQMQKNA
ncbi:TPA: hypothetical protein RQN12_004267 [Aeromonas dhakensis]|uniref:hypothetical protein n=1 Tax=Aeromonas hydrophila TaxID=644 RepID=UPI00288FB315|nr:hypothetical protein [Aeromonas dhakensis]